jgi:hypothetical protein
MPIFFIVISFCLWFASAAIDRGGGSEMNEKSFDSPSPWCRRFRIKGGFPEKGSAPQHSCPKGKHFVSGNVPNGGTDGERPILCGGLAAQ